MKLNLGCGKNYLDGFTNIDFYDSTVADVKMSVTDLKFESNVADEIQACQLIEHLGHFNTIYALAEWFRVLKPEGLLVLETPDLEKSFKNYIKGDNDIRKEILTWIFGIDIQGMEHGLCFPELFLNQLLIKSGFTNIKSSFFEIEKNHPILRICCKKPKHYQVYQIISNYRKKLQEKNIVKKQNYIVTIEQGELIGYFILKLNQFLKNNDYEIIDELIINGGIKNVKMTFIFLNECINQKLIEKRKVKKHLDILNFLISIRFSDILIYLIKKSPTIPGTRIKIFKTISEFGKQSIKKLLCNKDDTFDTRNALLKLSKTCPKSKIDFFSEKTIEYEAANFSYQGVKEFTQGNYQKAIIKFNEAVKLDRNYLLFYWNLARLKKITGQNSKAKRYYDNTIKLLRLSDYHDKERLEIVLKKEIDSPVNDECKKPIVDVFI